MTGACVGRQSLELHQGLECSSTASFVHATVAQPMFEHLRGYQLSSRQNTWLKPVPRRPASLALSSLLHRTVSAQNFPPMSAPASKLGGTSYLLHRAQSQAPRALP